MSFTITYKKFVSVRVKEQTTNNAITALKFRPSTVCRDLIKKHMLLFRHRNDGFNVYYKTYPEASVIVPSPITEKTKFSFGIRVSDSSFYSTYMSGSTKLPQFYLDNLKSDGSLNPGKNLTASPSFDSEDLVKINAQTFSQRTELPSINKPTQWRIKENFGAQDVLQTVAISPPDDSATFIYVTLNDKDKHKAEYIDEQGPYILETDKAQPEPVRIYLSDHIRKSRVNGIVDIYWSNSQTNAPADTGKEYQIIFKRN